MMKLFYTDITYDMTAILAKAAAQAADKGRRVFYIAPSSLSFEKERSVLQALPEHASFAITITRFTQMARYFVLNAPNQKQVLDDNGLAMIFYRALSGFADGDLQVFGRLKQDPHFINQLVDLYKELETSNLSVLELTGLSSIEKQADLIKIFTAVETILESGHYDNQSKIAFFEQEIRSGTLDEQLKHLTVIIDGFTRFSAEEESLVTLLHDKGVELLIGTYISQKAYKSNFTTGNVYQASLDFLRDLAQKFQVKPNYVISDKEGLKAFSKLSKLFEGNHDFVGTDVTLTDEDKQHCLIWEVVNQKEEVEYVAKAIRQKLYEGYRYKDILVLLGDVEAYQLQVGKIFDKYEIPYYFGKAESMSAHPLVQFVDSLERIKRYNFRAEDVMNLLKSGLYGRLSQDQLDQFDQYVTYADIKGQGKFFNDFTVTNGQFDLEALNFLREELMAPLKSLVKAQKQLASSLLGKLTDFLQKISLPANMTKLTVSLSETEQEKHEQVWKTFTHILEQFQTIFGDQKLTLAEMLSLLRSGMLAADYRTVPATVDVVTIKSYDLVEPHTNKFVFALGMTQSYFPKIVQNSSLISDEERTRVNENSAEGHYFDIPARDSLKKNHFTALSLFNAATQQLVLSLPRLLNETEDKMSSYLLELQGMGIPLFVKERNHSSSQPEDIGNYKALLSRVIELNHLSIDQELPTDLTKEEQTFWSVAVRYLRRKLRQEGLEFLESDDSVQTKPIAAEVMAARFPEDKPLSLSSSALTTFYNNQYLYFLQYVLALQELETIHPDARNHGTYLHRVFELVMKDRTSQAFDHKLEQAIETANQEDSVRMVYQEDEEGRYSLTVLEEIARSTAAILHGNDQLQTESEEESFEVMLGNTVQVKGIIDRIDRLSDGSLGIVDYKSSQNTFDIQKFYNGLNSQLLTYMQAIRAKRRLSEKELIFGAMYLHMQEPRIDLTHVGSLDQIPEKLHKELSYRGLFLEEEKEHLANGSYHLTDSIYSQAELAILLSYNRQLYTQAAQAIRKGHFLINPYSEDGRSVQGDQLKSITHFEADRHMPYARHLYRLPRKEKRQGFLKLMETKSKEAENHDV